MKRYTSGLAVLVLLAAVTACTLGRPMDADELRRMTDDVPEGPGLLTGEDEAFILYQR